ncbi:MAG: hypothetical protein ACI39F_03495 [Acutalibacteraceae bacterium]
MKDKKAVKKEKLLKLKKEKQNKFKTTKEKQLKQQTCNIINDYCEDNCLDEELEL